MNTTIENIPTVWHDQAGFPDDTALMATAVFAGADLTADIEKVLDDLAAAESWESMALRSVAR
jgi:3-hydroxyacyl-CoA dehydrogenase